MNADFEVQQKTRRDSLNAQKKKHRSRSEIIARILEVAARSRSGAPKFKLMYDSYLTHAQLTGYLGPLLEKELLSFDERTQRYSLTKKGQEFLDEFNKIDDVLRAFHPVA